MEVRIPNYLLQLPDEVRVHGVKEIVVEEWDRLGMSHNEFVKENKMNEKQLERFITLQLWGSSPTIGFLRAFASYLKNSEEFIEKLYVKSQGFSVGNSSPIILPKSLDKNLAYLIGALRDGSVLRFQTINRERFETSVYNKEKLWLEEQIVPKLFATFGVKPKITYARSIYYVRIESKVLALFLHEVFDHPFGEQAYWLTPKIIKASPKEIQISYIRGFWDAEGTCRRLAGYSQEVLAKISPTIDITQTSAFKDCPPLVDISTMLKDLKIKSKITMRKHKYNFPIYDLRIGGKENMARFCEIIGSNHPKKVHLDTLKRVFLSSSREIADPSRSVAP